ncbi:hypothetical protein L6164_026810 [Bauhinia variegata]|uniref:Uncharacterized protein n=1 Tax=Bauhinia variegata TaxID=167791 RepID=A0ACB9LRZ4_BAUVA|nr:hypothetical protein L6164_026810 [Bauhinia variegata]
MQLTTRLIARGTMLLSATSAVSREAVHHVLLPRLGYPYPRQVAPKLVHPVSVFLASSIPVLNLQLPAVNIVFNLNLNPDSVVDQLNRNAGMHGQYYGGYSNFQPAEQEEPSIPNQIAAAGDRPSPSTLTNRVGW